MADSKRRKLNSDQIELTSCEDLIYYEPLGSDTENSDIELEDNDARDSGLVDLASGRSEPHTENHQIQSRNKDENSTDKDQLGALLAAWGSTAFKDNLKNCGINNKNLKYLDESDYALLLRNEPKLGEMIVFRHFHRQWKNRPMDPQPQKQVNDVKYILNSGGEIADEIQKFFELKRYFTDDMRLKLIHLILKEKRYLSRKTQSNISDQICEIFPGESKIVYFEQLPEKQPTGLLYQAYNQTRTKKAIARSLASEQNTVDVDVDVDIDALLTDDVRSSIDFINNEENYKEENCGLLIMHHWELSFEYRNQIAYKNAEEHINNWLPLRKEDGNILINFDFVKNYGSECAQSLISKWDDFAFVNHNMILDEIKDAKEKKVLREALSENDVNIQNRIIMMALHHLSFLMPSRTLIKGRTSTPTVPDSKNTFFKSIKNKNGIKAEMNIRKVGCKISNIQEHPMIFELKQASKVQYFIGVGEIVYESDSFIEAVDEAFKIYVSFKIPFPPECVNIWLFINHMFYKIPLQQKPCAKLISMLDSFRF